MRYFKAPLRLTLITLMSLSLLLWLTGCVRLMVPPDEYLKDCPLTYLAVDHPTNDDILHVAVDRETDMKLCNADKRALRAWYDALEKSCGAKCKLTHVE